MKKLIIILFLLLLSVIAYYTMVVIMARNRTHEIVSNTLSSDRMKLNLSDLSDEQLNALLKVQDPNFYEHKGYDFSSTKAGLTTISQALVKKYYFDDFKPGIQKIEQILISRFAFDNMTPKDSILKLFINEVYLGENNGQELRGFENASLFYMGKPFKELTWDEYLSILAMIKAPETYNLKNNKLANTERVLWIKEMLKGDSFQKD